MGNVLVSLDDEHEELLRTLTKERYGGKKGSMSKVVQAALDELKKNAKRETAKKKLLQMLEKGLDLGFKGKAYESRDELYD